MRLEYHLERMLFASRWLLAPFFVGLVVAILALLLKFLKELGGLVAGVLSAPEYETVTAILTLVDTALLATLLLIIIFSGYENFVSKLAVGEHEDRPAWMGKVGFSDLKLKLIGVIVAVSAVELLKAFLATQHFTSEQMAWKIGIHLTFAISGVLFAVTDRIAAANKAPPAPPLTEPEAH